MFLLQMNGINFSFSGVNNSSCLLLKLFVDLQF